MLRGFEKVSLEWILVTLSLTSVLCRRTIAAQISVIHSPRKSFREGRQHRSQA
jgi:hypothetical protein